MLGQLGNRVQHALRAFTPRDQKAVKSAATTLRANPKLDVEAAITELAVGEALVSMLDDKGRPTVVERAFVVPPGTRVGPITAEERAALIKASALAGVYDKPVDRESAYEKLIGRVDGEAPAPGNREPQNRQAARRTRADRRGEARERRRLHGLAGRSAGRLHRSARRPARRRARSRGEERGAGDRVAGGSRDRPRGSRQSPRWAQAMMATQKPVADDPRPLSGRIPGNRGPCSALRVLVLGVLGGLLGGGRRKR